MVSACRWMQGDVFDRMAELPDASVDLIVTSPPFLALRSYLPAGHPDKLKEIGSEATPAAFLSTLLALTREWRRILAPHGSIAVELGDTYAGSKLGGVTSYGVIKDGQQTAWKPNPYGSASITRGGGHMDKLGPGWPLAKSLCLIPSLYAGSLAYGHNLLDPDDTIAPWRVRNLIVWHRPNPPVGALGDKVRPSTSYITTACVSPQRWFDLDAERTAPGPIGGQTVALGKPTGSRNDDNLPHYTNNHPAGAPPLDAWFDTTTEDVWTIPTAPYKGAHYATYPIALPRRLINLMCPREVCVVCGEARRRITEPTEEYASRPNSGKDFLGTNHDRGKGMSAEAPYRAGSDPSRNGATFNTIGWTKCDCLERSASDPDKKWRRGLVLDPFAGSGTTLAAAAELGRDAIGIDLDERNLDLARQRIGLFLEETA
jgi:site-specific DNA-methyltransferase (adenine-specific)